MSARTQTETLQAEILATPRAHPRRTAAQIKATSRVATSIDDARHAARGLFQAGRVVSDKQGGATGYRLSAPERAQAQQATS